MLERGIRFQCVLHQAKGNRVNIPEPERGYRVGALVRLHVYGNVTEPEDVGGRSGKSSLFLLTITHTDHGICLPGDMV